MSTKPVVTLKDEVQRCDTEIIKKGVEFSRLGKYEKALECFVEAL